MQVGHEKHINRALFLLLRRLQHRAFAAEQIRTPRMLNARAGESFDARGVREDEIRVQQLVTIIVEEQIGVPRQRNHRHRGTPQTRRNAGVVKLQPDEIGLAP